MKAEIVSFFPLYLPAVDAGEFWERCDSEISLHFRLPYAASRRRAV
jgi:hypothetical protein